MDKAALDALNKEMYELSLRHYQTSFQQDIIMPLQQPTISIQSANTQSNQIGANDIQPPQKERNNNRLADYQFNHIFSKNDTSNTSFAMMGVSSTMDYKSSKDVINQRMSGHSSLARAMAFNGFGSSIVNKK
jgi:hypothetical protein